MNICAKCEQKYYVAANDEDDTCRKKGQHLPKYDFTINENVLECEIDYS